MITKQNKLQLSSGSLYRRQCALCSRRQTGYRVCNVTASVLVS